MGQQFTEQEEILEMVKAGKCGDVLARLDKQQIKKFPSHFVSRLILNLIPQNTKASKELAELLLKYGKVNWSERDDNGRLIHAVLTRYGRVELASKAVAGLRKKDARDPELSAVWAGLLWWFLEKHQRTAVMAMLQKGVMRRMDDHEQERALKKILSCHDIGLLECACRYIRTIPAELLCEPETLSERQFMGEVLNRFRKYIETGSGGERLWELTLECDAEKMAEHLLKKTKSYQYLRQMAAGSESMSAIVLGIRCRTMPDEVKKEALYGALESSAWRERFEQLVHKGWKKSRQNRKKEILLAEEYAKNIEQKRYSPGRAGSLEKINDRTKAGFLRSWEQKQKEKG